MQACSFVLAGGGEGGAACVRFRAGGGGGGGNFDASAVRVWDHGLRAVSGAPGPDIKSRRGTSGFRA